MDQRGSRQAQTNSPRCVGEMQNAGVSPEKEGDTGCTPPEAL